MKRPIRVLLVRDSENDPLRLKQALRRSGFEPIIERVETPEAMSGSLSTKVWDLVISDFRVANFGANAALSVLKQSGLDLPFIIVSETIGEDAAVAAMKAGAHDCVMKHNLKRLGAVIERALQEAAVRRDHRRAEQRLKYFAHYDSVTHLPNRNTLYECIEQNTLFGREETKSLTLMVIDLDDFKEINDTLGHQSGDLLLKQVGVRLKCSLDEAHTVARLGGDEFGVFLPGVAEQDAVLVAGKLLSVLKPPFQIADLAIDVRASIGIAIFPQHGEDKDTLVRRAEIAMYAAKRSAKGYAIYSSIHDPYNPKRLALMADLHRAIDNNELFLTYQPKVDLASGQVIGVEALARWHHGKLGLIPPDQFIPMAERTGFIKAITIWGLESAISQFCNWREQGLEIPIAVNLSARSLQDSEIVERITDLLKGHDVPAEALELEITESLIMSNPEHAREFLTRVSRMGVALSIDDFGTGYSSLAYLKKLPVNSIKIDKSFVINMATDENDAAIVRSTIDLAHHLKLKVIAEGVEDRLIWNRLLALGCDTAQGYHISRPLPAPQLTEWLSNSEWALAKASIESVPQNLQLEW